MTSFHALGGDLSRAGQQRCSGRSNLSCLPEEVEYVGMDIDDEPDTAYEADSASGESSRETAMSSGVINSMQSELVENGLVRVLHSQLSGDTEFQHSCPSDQDLSSDSDDSDSRIVDVDPAGVIDTSNFDIESDVQWNRIFDFLRHEIDISNNDARHAIETKYVLLSDLPLCFHTKTLSKPREYLNSLYYRIVSVESRVYFSNCQVLCSKPNYTSSATEAFDDPYGEYGDGITYFRLAFLGKTVEISMYTDEVIDPQYWEEQLAYKFVHRFLFVEREACICKYCGKILINLKRRELSHGPSFDAIRYSKEPYHFQMCSHLNGNNGSWTNTDDHKSSSASNKARKNEKEMKQHKKTPKQEHRDKQAEYKNNKNGQNNNNRKRVRDNYVQVIQPCNDSFQPGWTCDMPHYHARKKLVAVGAKKRMLDKGYSSGLPYCADVKSLVLCTVKRDICNKLVNNLHYHIRDKRIKRSDTSVNSAYDVIPVDSRNGDPVFYSSEGDEDKSQVDSLCYSELSDISEEISYEHTSEKTAEADSSNSALGSVSNSVACAARRVVEEQQQFADQAAKNAVCTDLVPIGEIHDHYEGFNRREKFFREVSVPVMSTAMTISDVAPPEDNNDVEDARDHVEEPSDEPSGEDIPVSSSDIPSPVSDVQESRLLFINPRNQKVNRSFFRMLHDLWQYLTTAEETSSMYITDPSIPGAGANNRQEAMPINYQEVDEFTHKRRNLFGRIVMFPIATASDVYDYCTGNKRDKGNGMTRVHIKQWIDNTADIYRSFYNGPIFLKLYEMLYIEIFNMQIGSFGSDEDMRTSIYEWFPSRVINVLVTFVKDGKISNEYVTPKYWYVTMNTLCAIINQRISTHAALLGFLPAGPYKGKRRGKG